MIKINACAPPHSFHAAQLAPIIITIKKPGFQGLGVTYTPSSLHSRPTRRECGQLSGFIFKAACPSTAKRACVSSISFLQGRRMVKAQH